MSGKTGKSRARNGAGTAYYDSERNEWRVQLSTRDRHGIVKRISGRGENAKKAQVDARRKLEAFLIEQSELAAQEAAAVQAAAAAEVTEQMVLADWAEQFLREKAETIKPTTVDNYTRMFRTHILPALGGYTLQDLVTRPEIMRAFYLTLSRAPSGRKNRATGEAQRYAPETVRTARAALSSALTHAVESGVISHVPTVRLTVARDRQRELELATARPLEDTDVDAAQRIDAWTEEEAARFVDVALKDRWGVVLVFLLATGMRRGEALGLQWDQVDLRRGRVRVIRNLVKVAGGRYQLDTPKSRASRRTLPLSPLAVACLEERQRQQAQDRVEVGRAWVRSGYVFTQIRGKHLNGDNLRREMRRLAAQAGVRPVTIHTLRDTFATLRRRRGVGLEVISRYLGHQDPAMTLRRYRQVQPDELEQCASDLFAPSPARRTPPDEEAGAVGLK